MRPLLFAFVLVTAGAAVAGPKPGEEGTPEFEKATGLVKQLGHPRFPVREAAATQLVEMGHAAVPALRQGAKADDQEVRSRSAALLPQAKAAGWKRMSDALLAKPEEKYDLPLLADWDKLIGKSDTASRKLFANILQTDGDFLDQVAADRKKAAAICAARCEAILDQVRSPEGQRKAELGSLTAVLFVDTLSPARFSRSEDMPAYLLKNPGLAESFDAAETGPPIRRLLIRWVEAQPAYSPVAKVQFAELARKKPFPEAVPVLAKLAKDTANRQLIMRLLAIEALGAAGSKDAAAALAELVPDATVMLRLGGPDGPEGPRFGEQALAASLILHGKKVEDYGLTSTKQYFFPPVGKDNIPMTVYGFRDDEARAKAIRKWEAEVAAKDGGKK